MVEIYNRQFDEKAVAEAFNEMYWACFDMGDSESDNIEYAKYVLKSKKNTMPGIFEDGIRKDPYTTVAVLSGLINSDGILFVYGVNSSDDKKAKDYSDKLKLAAEFCEACDFEDIITGKGAGNAKEARDIFTEVNNCLAKTSPEAIKRVFADSHEYWRYTKGEYGGKTNSCGIVGHFITDPNEPAENGFNQGAWYTCMQDFVDHKDKHHSLCAYFRGSDEITIEMVMYDQEAPHGCIQRVNPMLIKEYKMSKDIGEKETTGKALANVFTEAIDLGKKRCINREHQSIRPLVPTGFETDYYHPDGMDHGNEI